jgi:hypothetical protein
MMCLRKSGHWDTVTAGYPHFLGDSMSGSIPQTPEEFQFWMVEKVGEIQASQATALGKLETATANYSSLEKRVSSVEDDARSATRWENGKFIAMGALQTILIWFKHTAGLHGA